MFDFSSLAALGLIENNAPNITAAMLVSPLMGPVMSITFGIIISDYKLVVNWIFFYNKWLQNQLLSTAQIWIVQSVFSL